MLNAKPFLRQTGQTALFALREYFRPLIVAAMFLKSRLASAKPVQSTEGGRHEKARPRKREERELGEAPMTEQE